MKLRFMSILYLWLLCMPLFGEVDYQSQGNLRFYTNLPEDTTAPSQLFVATANLTSNGSTLFRFYRSETGLKPAEPFWERTESDCSERCEINLVLEATAQVTTISFWLEVETETSRITRALQVSVDDSAPSCPAPSFATCDCGTSIEAGCPFQSLDSGKSFPLLGAVDHPDFDSELPPAQSYSWSVLPEPSLEGVKLTSSMKLIDAKLETPPVVTPKPILLQLEGTVNGCTCKDISVIKLEASQAHVDLSLKAVQTEFRLTQGDRTTHELIVKNNGRTRASEVKLQIPFPDSFEILEAGGEGVDCTSNENEIHCDMGTITGGSERLLNILSKATRTGNFSIEGNVASSRIELTPEDNQFALEITVLPWLPELIFPMSLGTETPFPERQFVGISLLNTDPEPVDVELTRLGAAGNRLGTSLFSEITGSKLAPGAQEAILVEDLQDESGGSLLAIRSNNRVQGFSLFGDYRQTRLDGFPVGLTDAKRLILPSAIQDTNKATRAYLFNPDPDQMATVIIRLFDAAGQLIAERSVELPPLGSISQTIQELFGVPVIDGYLETTSDIPVRGFEVLATGSSLSGIPAQTSSNAPRFMIPHFFISEEPGGGELRIVNTGSSDAVVTVRGFRDNGTFIGGSILNLPARRLLNADTRNLFFGSDESQTGYLQVEIEAAQAEDPPPQIAGAISFSTGGGQARASLPLSVPAKTTIRFLQVAQSPTLSIFTGLAILNPNNEAVEVTIRVFDQQGTQSAERTLQLLGKQRVLGLLPEILEDSDFAQVGGHIEVSGESPLVSFALFGDFSQEYLAAVEGQ